MKDQIHKHFSHRIILSALFAFLLLTGITANATADQTDQKIRENLQRIQEMRQNVNYLTEILDQNLFLLEIPVERGTIVVPYTKKQLIETVNYFAMTHLLLRRDYSRSQLTKRVQEIIKSVRDKSNAVRLEIEKTTIPKLKREIAKLEKETADLQAKRHKQQQETYSKTSYKGILESHLTISELGFSGNCRKTEGQNKWMCNWVNGCSDSQFKLKSLSKKTGKIIFDRTDLTCSFSKGLKAEYECTLVGDALKDCKRKITNAGTGNVRPTHLLNKWQNVTIQKKQ
jgi:hypothetical protein